MPRKGVTQVGLRVPNAVMERMQAAAERNGRSVNAEMVARLESSADTDFQLQMTIARLEAKEEHSAALEAAMAEDQATIRKLAVALADAMPSAVRAALKEEAKAVKPDEGAPAPEPEQGLKEPENPWIGPNRRYNK